MAYRHNGIVLGLMGTSSRFGICHTKTTKEMNIM